MRPRRRAVVLVTSLLAVLTTACTAPDWATWGNGPSRLGEQLSETTITTANASQLQQKWSVDLGSIINSAPVLAHGVNVNGTATDLLFLGTEHGVLYAVTTSGQIAWYTGLGVKNDGCSLLPDSNYGINSSPVYDKATNRVYAAGGDGYAYALDASTGAVVSGWPVQLTTTPNNEMVWGAPTLVGSHLYFEIASNCDLRPYHGRIIDINPSTHTITNTFYTMGGPNGPDGAGIWGYGGVSVDSSNGDVYAATGNSFANPENTPYGDSIIRLSANLAVKAYATPSNAMGDDDFGSTPVLYQASGCPPQLVAMQKNGSVYLYDQDNLANGYRQRIGLGRANQIGVAAYSTATHLLYIVNAKGSSDGTYVKGVAAFNTGADCMLHLAWQTSLPVSGATAPTVANGVVFVPGGGSNKLYALNATTGVPLWDSGTTITGKVFAESIVVDGRVYAASWDHMLHAYGF